jgi:hypothetical protein
MRAFLLVLMLVLVGGRGAVAQARTQAESDAWERVARPWHAPEGVAGSAPLDVNALLALQVKSGEASWARRGAVLGALVGGIATYLVTHHGGSTSLCDRSANQDAMGQRECVALTVAGSAVGAGLGAWIGSRIRRK